MAHREQRRSDPHRQARNRDWVEWLARERQARLIAVARRAGVPAQDAADVVQTALLNVIRFFPGPDVADNVFAYAAKAVAGTASKHHRRNRRKEGRNVAIGEERGRSEEPQGRVFGLHDPSEPDPLERALERLDAQQRRAALRGLPAEQRAALVLSAAGYRLEEIAAALGLSVRATRKRIEKGNRAQRERG